LMVVALGMPAYPKRWLPLAPPTPTQAVLRLLQAYPMLRVLVPSEPAARRD